MVGQSLDQSLDTIQSSLEELINEFDKSINEKDIEKKDLADKVETLNKRLNG